MSKMRSVIGVKGWNRGGNAIKVAGLDWIIDWLSEGSPYCFSLPYYLLLPHGMDRVSFSHPHATHDKQVKPSPATARSPPLIHFFVFISFPPPDENPGPQVIHCQFAVVKILALALAPLGPWHMAVLTSYQLLILMLMFISPRLNTDYHRGRGHGHGCGGVGCSGRNGVGDIWY